MSKVLLDIGAHTGETLSVALDPKWRFDRIFSFEPASTCWPMLESLADERTVVLKFGLWSADTDMKLYDPGAIGASVHLSKSTHHKSVTAHFKDAARWFEDNISTDDEVIVKLNCEGSECEVLDRLLETGQLSKVDELLVHFDVRKVPGLDYREHKTRAAMDEAGIRYRPADSIFFGRNTQDKTANWLGWYHAKGWHRLRYSLLRRVEFALRVPIHQLRKRLEH